MRMRHIITLATLLALCAPQALAREGGETYGRFHGGILFYSFEEAEGYSIGNTNDFNLGGGVGHFLNPWLSIEGEVSWSNGSKYDVTIDDVGGGVSKSWRQPSPDIWLYNANCNIYMVDASVTPYLTVGLGGATFTKVDSQIVDVTYSNGITPQEWSPEIPSRTDFSLNAGAGFDVSALRFEYRAFFVFQEDNTGTLHRFTAGLVFGAL